MLVILETPKVVLEKKNQADILLLEIRPFKSYANYIIVCLHYLRMFSDNPLKIIEPKAFRWVNIQLGMQM